MTQVQKKDMVKEYRTKGMEIRKTTDGEIVFINTELVSKKLIDIMVNLLNFNEEFNVGSSEGHGIYSVVFRDDGGPYYPSKDGEFIPVPWLFNEASKSLICNLRECVELAINQGISEEEGFENSEFLSSRVLTWQHILSGFLHEVHHAESFTDSYIELMKDEDRMEKEEKAADEFAFNMLIEAAKVMDLEMDLGPVEAVFNEIYERRLPELEAELSSVIAAGGENDKLDMFLTVQKVIEEEGMVWYMPDDKDEEKDVMFNTYREFLHYVSGDSEDWGSGPEPQKVVYNNGPQTAPGFGGVSYEYAPAEDTQPGYPAPEPEPHIAYVQPESNLDPVTFQAAIKTLYTKIANHIFANCAYNPMNGPGKDFFNTKSNVLMKIALEGPELNLVKGYVNDRGETHEAEGFIEGKFIDFANTLPGYELLLKKMDGTITRRKFIPQNPWKVNQAGAYSMTAQLAQNGAQILWVIDPDSAQKNFAVRVFNGRMESNNNGTWQEV